MGAIVFLFMVVVLILISFPWLSKLYGFDKKEPVFPYYVYGILMVFLSSVAMAFYLYYIASVYITFFIAFKIVLICLAPPVILRSSDILRTLKMKNEMLGRQLSELNRKMEKYEDDRFNQPVEFISENASENIKITASDVVFVRSADNYAEIIYLERGNHKKHLVRNTLKNIEEMVKPFPNLLRCHRTYIVNLQHIKRLTRQDNNHLVDLRDYDEQIPVSRQYIINLKEALKNIPG
jgi:DNA-binding LytR/AlgR family response regulator